MRIIAFGILLCGHILMASAADRKEFDVVGEWTWKPVDAVCPERYIYRVDGTFSAESGEERLEKTYQLSKTSGSMYRLESTVTSTNGKPDCQGNLSPVGAKSRVYLMPLNGGGFFTCASEDTMSCFGTAGPVRQNP
jgi:hypothetical protein